MTRKQRSLGESQISYFLIVGLVILVCFTAAVTLGREFIALIVGSDKAAQYMGHDRQYTDPDGDDDLDGIPNGEDPDP